MTERGCAPHNRTGDRSAPWYSAIDLSRPYWRDYRRLILSVKEGADHGPDLPAAWVLQRILPEHRANATGQAVTFVPGRAIPGNEYETRILQTGEISTRENSWHDFFNALVWARFPRLKSAINALHCQQISRQTDARRSRLRDALTLLDECGVIVAGTHGAFLERLAARDWQAVFSDHEACWGENARVFICGHALLEKLLSPYKSLTAHAVLIQLSPTAATRSREDVLKMLDARLAETLLQGALFESPAGLSPVPLMGLPGWWLQTAQNQDFYADCRVFRRPADDFTPAPIFEWSGLTCYQDMP